MCEWVDGPVTLADLQGVGGANGFVEPAGGPAHGVYGAVSPGQAGGDRRGQRAARAVCVARVHPRHRDAGNLASRGDHGIIGLGSLQVPALGHHHGPSVRRKDAGLFDGGVHGGGGVIVDKHRKFRQVRGEHVGVLRQGNECGGGIVGKQVIAKRRHHHRIEDHRALARGDELRDQLRDLRRTQHADLDRVHRHVIEDGVQLGAQKLQRRGVDLADPARVLRHQRGDHAIGEAAGGGDRLDIGLDAGPSGGVGAGDGQNARNAGARRAMMHMLHGTIPSLVLTRIRFNGCNLSASRCARGTPCR